MISFLLIIASFFSIILFDFLPIQRFIKTMFASQKASFTIIANKTIEDKEKQKLLLKSALKTLIETGKLTLFFFIALSPFISLIYAGPSVVEKTNFYKILTSLKGVFISGIVFLLYYLLKKKYGKFGL